MSSSAEYVGCAHSITAKSSLLVTNSSFSHPVSFGRFHGGRLKRRDIFNNLFFLKQSWGLVGCGVTIQNHNSQAHLVSAVGWHPIIQLTFVSSQPTLLCWFWWGRTLAGHSVLPTSRYPDIGGCLWQTPFSAVWCRAYAGRRSRPTYFSVSIAYTHFSMVL